MQAATARRNASIVFALAVLVFLAALYVGLVYYQNTIDFGASGIAQVSLYQWGLIFGVALAVLLAAMILLYFLPREGGTLSNLLHVVCANCQTDFDVTDPGSRPVAYACPACGTPGEIGDAGAPELDAQVVSAPADAFSASNATLDANVEALLVRCTNCRHEFELPYTTDRPVHSTCPRCGEPVVLDEGEDVLSSAGQDVIDIEGIGPAYAKKLAKARITSTEQLRQANLERLHKQTAIPKALLKSWKAQCDLIRLRGVGKQYAEVLVRSGVGSVEELAGESPAHLVARIKSFLGTLETPPFRGGVDEARVRRWITAARNLDLDRAAKSL